LEGGLLLLLFAFISAGRASASIMAINIGNNLFIFSPIQKG
jgi:hypothetical protein